MACRQRGPTTDQDLGDGLDLARWNRGPYALVVKRASQTQTIDDPARFKSHEFEKAVVHRAPWAASPVRGLHGLCWCR